MGLVPPFWGKKAKVELIPPFLLEAIVELVPPTLENVISAKKMYFQYKNCKMAEF